MKLMRCFGSDPQIPSGSERQAPFIIDKVNTSAASLAVADLDILNRGVYLLILSQIYILKLKKNFYINFFFCGARGVLSMDTPKLHIDLPVHTTHVPSKSICPEIRSMRQN